MRVSGRPPAFEDCVDVGEIAYPEFDKHGLGARGDSWRILNEKEVPFPGFLRAVQREYGGMLPIRGRVPGGALLLYGEEGWCLDYVDEF